MFVTSLLIFLALQFDLCAQVHSRPEQLHYRVELDDLWMNFKKSFSKVYDDDITETYRRSVWEQNLDYIQKHNTEADLGLHSYTLGVNQYADLTEREYRSLLLRATVPFSRNSSLIVYLDDSFFDYASVPDTIDWRLNGSVTPVQNQGQCGSCWAFSATGALEGQWYKKTGRLIKLSEQNLIDCSGSFGNHGCQGGWMNYAFDYISNNSGIDTEDSYPYDGTVKNCRFNPANIGATCNGAVSPSRDNEKALKQAVGTVGPISVAVDASQRSFQLYKSGVYNEPNCTQKVDHAMLIVGYGTFNGLDYWLVKNSWGTFWGENGYIRMSRNLDNQCAIAKYPIFPVV